jgi:hypothetical protein
MKGLRGCVIGSWLEAVLLERVPCIRLFRIAACIKNALDLNALDLQNRSGSDRRRIVGVKTVLAP